MKRPCLGGTTVCYPLGVSAEFTLERALRGIERSKLEYVELCSIPEYCEHVMPGTMGDGDVEKLGRTISSYGLTTGVVNIAADLTTSEGTDELIAGLRLGEALGADVVVTNVDHICDEETRERFLSNIETIVDTAEKTGVRVGVETHGGVCATGRETMAFVKALGSAWIGMTYDIANVVYFGGVDPVRDLEEMIDEFSDYTVHVHLKDKATSRVGEYIFPPFGEGIVEFEKVITLFERSGYDGRMTVEVELDGRPESAELVDAALADSVSYLERFWG